MATRFNHLNVPQRWRHEWSKYPEGYTILEALLNWITQVDNMVDNQNTLNQTVENYGTRLDDFIEQFDDNLKDEVTSVLSEWQASGFLDIVINEALQTQMDVLEQETEQKLSEFNTQLEEISVSISMFPRLAGETDDTNRIQRAIDSLGGTHDLGSAYTYEPAKTLFIPAGVYTISSRLLVTKNNIRIIGSGMFNTRLLAVNTSITREMVRFKGAYACELSNITLDGGLPFTPTGNELYGADIGLVLDQTAHFHSENLNICNTRYEGKRAIHLWESYFENLRLFNIGFFGNGDVNRSAGIRFTLEGKEENTFGGGESNNITYNKVAFGCVGSYVSMDEVPAYNVFFDDVIAEGRTWNVKYPSVGETKWRLGGTSRNVVINKGYTYAHEQPFQSNAKLFDFINVHDGCKVLNYSVYQENTLTGHYNEITQLIQSTSVYPVEIDISIQEKGGAGGYLEYVVNSSAGADVYGKLIVTTDRESTIDDLFHLNSLSRFFGEIGMKTPSGLKHYENRSDQKQYSTIGAGTTAYEEFKCRAWVSFNGITGEVLGSGNVSSVVKNGTGNYTINFETPMPDTYYCTNVSATKATSPNEAVEIGGQAQNNVNVVNREGVTFYDTNIINVSIFR